MKLFIQLGWFFRQQWQRYLIAISLLITVSGLQLISPRVVGLLVDDVVAGNATNTVIFKWIGLLLSAALLIYILRYFWRMTLFGASFQLAVQLRNQFYQQLSRQSPNFYLRHRTGDLIARATNDVDRVVFAAGEGILTLIDSLVMGCAVLIIMSTQISWQLTLLALLPMPIMAAIVKRYGSELHARFKTAQEAFSSLNDQTQDSLSSIRMIKSFGLEQYQSQLFARVAEDAGQKNMRVAQVDAKFDPTIYLSVAFANMLAVGGGGWMVINNQLTIGELTSFVMYLGLMIWPMLALAWMFNIVERGSAAYTRIVALLREAPDVKQGDREVPCSPATLRVEVGEFRYPTADSPTLEDIHICLEPGGMLGVCGPTGAGKSTLLALIQRQFDLNQGQITYGAIPIDQFKLSEWRLKLAVVNQTSFLFSASIAYNIALGRPDATREQIERVARLANIHDDILRLPHGYDTEVGERGVMLSGGQKQRVAIARALLTDSEILILDDALSAVDGNTEYQILSNLQEWGKERTLIVTSHRLSALLKADEIVVLQNGRVLQRGDHDALIKQGGWYYSMYRYQQLEAELEEPGPEAMNDEQ